MQILTSAEAKRRMSLGWVHLSVGWSRWTAGRIEHWRKMRIQTFRVEGLGLKAIGASYPDKRWNFRTLQKRLNCWTSSAKYGSFFMNIRSAIVQGVPEKIAQSLPCYYFWTVCPRIAMFISRCTAETAVNWPIENICLVDKYSLLIGWKQWLEVTARQRWRHLRLNDKNGAFNCRRSLVN